MEKSPVGPVYHEVTQAKKRDIGLRISELRHDKKLTIEQLSNELGIAKSVVSRWETDNSVSLKNVEKLSKFFGVSCDYLITGIKTENLALHYKTGLSQDAIDKLNANPLFQEMVNLFSVAPGIDTMIEILSGILANQHPDLYDSDGKKVGIQSSIDVAYISLIRWLDMTRRLINGKT